MKDEVVFSGVTVTETDLSSVVYCNDDCKPGPEFGTGRERSRHGSTAPIKKSANRKKAKAARNARKANRG